MRAPKVILWWKKHQFKVLVGICLLIILGLYIVNPKREGTWSLNYAYNPETKELKFVRESKGERECRRVLEKIFMRPFPNRRLDFLVNSETGKRLEVDCCNMELRLGVEYNGIQHYQFVPAMHRTIDAFHAQQHRDALKRQLCADNDFTLIVVPYVIPVASIEMYLREELRRHGCL